MRAHCTWMFGRKEQDRISTTEWPSQCTLYNSVRFLLQVRGTRYIRFRFNYQPYHLFWQSRHRAPNCASRLLFCTRAKPTVQDIDIQYMCYWKNSVNRISFLSFVKKTLPFHLDALRKFLSFWKTINRSDLVSIICKENTTRLFRCSRSHP